MGVGISKILLILAVLCAAWFVATCTYNAFFHPLRRIPGPKLAAATVLYEWYFELFKSPGGQYMFEIDRLHDVYGPIVRINPREVHIRDSEFHDKFMSPKGQIDKDPHFSQATGAPLSLFGLSRHEIHEVRRHAMNQFFDRAAISALEPMLMSNIDRTCQIIDGYASRLEPINLRAAIMNVTIDMVSEWVFGETVNALAQDKFDPSWERMMFGTTEAAPLAKVMPGIIGLAEILPIGLVTAMYPLIGAYLQFGGWIHGRVKEARTNWLNKLRTSHAGMEDKTAYGPDKALGSTRGKPLMQMLLESRLLPPSDKEEESLRQEAIGIVSGANEPTASVLTCTVFHVLNNQTAAGLVERLKSELETVPSHPFSWKHLEQLPVLTAVCKEGLRTAATMTTRLPRLRSEPMSYGDFVIPARTVVSMTTRDLLRDPAVFPDPEKFEPDRWLAASDEQRELMDRNFAPFSRGPRTCIGQQFAYMQMYHFMAALISRYDLDLEDTLYERDIKTVRDYVVGKAQKSSKGVFIRVNGHHRLVTSAVP